MKNIWIISVIVCLVVGVGSFYGGMKYAQSQTTRSGGGRMSQVGDGRFAGGAGGVFVRNGGGPGSNGGFTTGDVLSKDDKSITLQMRDGGSKIVFYTTSTRVSKMTDGSMEDVVRGRAITVTGATNSDGSITAQMIQLRPTVPPMGATGTVTNQ